MKGLLNPSRVQQHREQVAQDRLMTALERSFAPRVFSAINAAALSSAKAVGTNGRIADLTSVTVQLADTLDKLFKIQIRRTVDVFGQRTIGALKSFVPAMIEAKQVDLFSRETQAWILTQSAIDVQHVTETTMRQIRMIMTEAFEAGLTNSETARLIAEKTGGLIAKSRAVTIARTETHVAANYGSLQGAKATGVAKKKIWIAADDERARETHAAADSRYSEDSGGIGLDEYFSVGSDSMLAPGMGSQAGENINCRCIVAYIA